MNKKLIIIISIIILILLTIPISIHLYNKYRVEHAIKIVELSNDKIEVFSSVSLKDIIKNINGKLLENKKIDTTKIGKKNITFKYINDDNIKIDYTISVEIVDTTPPIIATSPKKTVTVGYNEDIEKEIFCGDNYDPNPKCIIEGEYDLNTPGTYYVKFKGIDSSNNESSTNLTITVREKTNNNTTNNNQSSNNNYTSFEYIKENYKTDTNKIGIDISYWQGNIDYKKVKSSGVEFVYIRVGRGNGIGKEYIEDSKFKEYIQGFNNVNIPVGVYFYSNANSIEDIKKEVKWIVNKIKNYKVDLEVVYDWENWAYFQEYDLSFYSLTETAKVFNKELKKYGYQGMTYSSKYYLENMWFELDTPIWLAHYTKQTNYNGKYKVWQICDDGKVDGIDDNTVDIDIMYK